MTTNSHKKLLTIKLGGANLPLMKEFSWHITSLRPPLHHFYDPFIFDFSFHEINLTNFYYSHKKLLTIKIGGTNSGIKTGWMGDPREQYFTMTKLKIRNILIPYNDIRPSRGYFFTH